MLDQADFIARYDKYDALGVVAALPAQLHQPYVVEGLDQLGGVKQVVLVGMGGSALAAEFVKTWLSSRLTVSIEIVRDYDLPAFVGPSTLVIASSYSGNTEETLAALEVAEARGAMVVAMASGGQLLEEARGQGRLHVGLVPDGHPHFDLPPGLQPRMAVLYGVKALAVLLEGVGLARGLVAELEAAASWMQGQMADWAPGRPIYQNPAKRMAEQVVGHPVVVYAGPTLAPMAMKWKIGFNENAKNLAFFNVFSELNHNEFMGWAHPKRVTHKVIELRSGLDHPQIKKRFEITNRLLSDRFAPIQVQAAGETRLQQLLWTLVLGDYVTVYVAILNHTDPTPVGLVERLKDELAS